MIFFLLFRSMFERKLIRFKMSRTISLQKQTQALHLSRAKRMSGLSADLTFFFANLFKKVEEKNNSLRLSVGQFHLLRFCLFSEVA